MVDSNLTQVLYDLIEDVSRDASKLMTSLAEALSDATPKRTGHAASNWIWSETGRSSPAGSRESPTWTEFLAGLSWVAHYSITWGIAYLDNAVSYMEDLNKGSSPKAPADFVSLTIRQVLTTLGIK